MDAITHLLVGYLLGQGLVAHDPVLLGLTVLFAVLPDLDTVTWVRPIRGVRHRGITHSLVFGGAASVLAATGLALTGVAGFWTAFGCAALGFVSHVALDVLNWGCLLLWPWRRGPVHFTVQAGLRTTAMVSFFALAALTATRQFAPALLDTLEFALGAGFVAYLLLRVAAKWVALRVHGGHGDAFPTANPLVWMVLPPGTTFRAGARRVHCLFTRPRRP